MSNLVVGVVMGSRKCGTTWLYENFKKDPDISVSRKVKESGFFACPDDTDARAYEKLYPKGRGNRVEVDSSLIYSHISARKIMGYNPAMRVALILREPVEYAVSRYIQAIRKGEISEKEISKAVVEEELLRSELDYPELVKRLEDFESKGNVLIVPYSLLQNAPSRFYFTVKSHLIGNSSECFEPSLEKINVARKGRWTVATSVLSHAAVMARRHKLHSIVNLAKAMGLHKLFEKSYDNYDIHDLKKIVSPSIVENYASSVSLYGKIERKFADD